MEAATIVDRLPPVTEMETLPDVQGEDDDEGQKQLGRDPKDQVVTYDREYFQVVGELGGFFVINGKAFPSTEPMEATMGVAPEVPPKPVV